jgi:ribosomal protein S18 acetylase RimI-like enzyme
MFDNPHNTVSLVEYKSVGEVRITTKVVGYALTKPSRKPKQAKLLSIAIAPPHQGKGLFKRLMTSVERRLKKEKYKKLVMEARMKNQFNEKIKKVYKKRINEIGKPFDSNIGLLEPIVIKL